MIGKKNALADKFFFELMSIFKENGWDIEESKFGESSVFDMFCNRLEELETDADRELMIELTRKYLVVDVEEYSKHMITVFRKFSAENKEIIKKFDEIHMFPVQDKNYPAKTKSGNVMCYLFQGIFMRSFETFRNKSIRIIETFEGLEKYKKNIECLLLVDDFVGTGDTILRCISLIEEIGIPKDKIKALTLVMQEQGKNAVETYGVDIFSAILRNKAITDNYCSEEAEIKKAQMRNISKCIQAKRDLYLGYKESEGLVSMIKTPNNTFPFYWQEYKRDGNMSVAPFARRNNVGVDE